MKNKLLITAVLAGLFFSRHYWLPLPGIWLTVPDNIQKADCLVVLRGDEYTRFKKMAALWKEGYAKTIMISITPGISKEALMIYKMSELDKISNKDLTLKYFEYFGISAESIVFTDSEVTSTFNEAAATKRMMLEKGFKSLLLVTSEYHMRRALLIFKLVFRGTGIEIYNATAESGYEPSRWWQGEGDVRRLTEEYGSFLVNIVYYGFQHKEFWE